ncbi:MAG: aldehyde dehydrogenase family protein [Deinococcales bacterium]
MQTKLYIGGQWLETNATLPVINPSTETVLHNAPAASNEDINTAVQAARKAFLTWKNTPAQIRADYLFAIAEGIKAHKEELARLETLQNGKPLPEALWDIDDTAACFEYYAGLAKTLKVESEISLPHPDFSSVARLEPVGVVGQIIPWNYPLLMLAWKVAPALAAGCCSVLKPSELTPLTALELARIAHQAGLPAGVLNVVSGGREAGAALAKHPDVDKLAFTGSVATGRKVMLEAAQGIKNVTLELGGKSPILVFDDATLEQAVEWVMFGIFWNKGEVCSATSRLLVQAGIAARLFERLKFECEKIKIGDPLEDGVLLGPLVSSGQYQKVLSYLECAKTEGLKLLTGGKRPAHLQKGYFLEPTIFTDVPQSSRLWNEEIFGPVLVAKTFETEAEALALANQSDFGLGAAVLSRDLQRCERVARELQAGIVWINCSQPTFCEAPWGGYKQSGIGRELGQWGLENYLETKQITRYNSDKPWGWYLK